MSGKELKKYRGYPEGHVELEVGCKVEWYTYKTIEEAKECAETAKCNARIRASEGYDFGYQYPGDIQKLPNGTFRVTCP